MEGKGKKKSKASKKITINLSSFLADDKKVPFGYTVVKPNIPNWADAMEDEVIDDRFNVVLPTAPKASRGPTVDVARVPTQPPFTAYIGNLPYDIMEDEIIRFFKNMKIVSVRLPKEIGERSRMRGFGYVEFETRDNLIEALSLNNEKLRSRIVKINLAEDHNGDRRRSGNEDNTSDWRSKYNEPRDKFRGHASYEGRRYEDERYGSRDHLQERSHRGGDTENSWRKNAPSDPCDSPVMSTSEKPKERQRLMLLPRTVPKEESSAPAPPASIFGGAKPVNTYSREKEIVEKKLESLEISTKASSSSSNKPTTSAKSATATNPPAMPVSKSAIFGQAKPVDTAARELEIEQKLRSQQEREEDIKNRSGAPRSFARTGGPKQFPSRKPPAKIYDFENKRSHNDENDGDSSPEEMDKKSLSKTSSDEKIESLQRKKYSSQAPGGTVSILPESKHNIQKMSDKSQDYIISNKFSNLADEDSEEEEAHDSN